MSIVGLADIPLIFKKSVPVIWLKDYYMPVVYAYIRDIAQSQGIIIQSLLVQDISFEGIQTQCAMSFLGQTSYYWLGNYEELPKKKQDQLRSYLVSYTGPHTLICAAANFVSSTPSEWMVITIPTELSVQSTSDIIEAWYANTHHAYVISSLISYWYKKMNQPIQIEQFFMLDMYARVVGKSITDFVEAYEPYIMTQRTSLFVLSQYFFSGNQKSFYQDWSNIADTYQLPYWITFWSDQLWRAYAFITYMNNHNKQAAYEISKNKLPYSFTKDGWQFIVLDDITQAHNQLYTLDVLTKNGHSAHWIELFFIQWFNRRSIRQER